jgi:sarcosine oxidase
MSTRFDAAVIGAGVFGAWCAHWLHKAGLRVSLIDAYGPANSRSSSGGESRITRMAYGDDEIYSRWALRSLPEWRELERRSGQKLFHQTGVLTFSDDRTQWVQKSIDVIRRIGGECEHLAPSELAARFPQVHFHQTESAVFEPTSGALLSRRAVQLLVEELLREGMAYRQASISPRVDANALRTSTGEIISAGIYVFACGPWLPKLFPELLAHYIRPVRAEVFFLGAPPGLHDFDSPQMPTWIFMGDENWDAYGMPNLESRGFKLAVDLIQQPADPDDEDRQTTAPYIEQMRNFVRDRFPLLSNAPIIETRVCQYENTPTHHYLIDRHPSMQDVWLVGGGSGHGFKNGPAVGAYVADLITKNVSIEPTFQLPLR